MMMGEILETADRGRRVRIVVVGTYQRANLRTHHDGSCARECARRQYHVGVVEEQKWRMSQFRTAIPRCRDSQVPRLPAHFHIESGGDFGGVIGGIVVDDNYFIIVGDLREHRAQASRKSRRGVASGDDHRNSGGLRLVDRSHGDTGEGHYYYESRPCSRRFMSRERKTSNQTLRDRELHAPNQYGLVARDRSTVRDHSTARDRSTARRPLLPPDTRRRN